MIDNSLFYLSPHPSLLPEGEGIMLIIELCNFMSSIYLLKLFVLLISRLTVLQDYVSGTVMIGHFNFCCARLMAARTCCGAVPPM